MSSVKYFLLHKLLMYNDTQKNAILRNILDKLTHTHVTMNAIMWYFILEVYVTYTITLLHTSFLYTVIQEWKMDMFIFKACACTHVHTHTHTECVRTHVHM